MNVGIHDGLIDPKHEEAMGQAVWLFMWCVRCQTRDSGLVLGGMPLTYEAISQRSGFAARKVRRWLDILRAGNYIHVSYLNFKMLRLRVLKPKKWHPKQTHIPFPATDHKRSDAIDHKRSVALPKTVNGATKNGQFKQSCILRNRTPETLAAEPANTAAAAAAPPPVITLPDNPEAWLALGWVYPQGHTRFQQAWLLYFGTGAGQNAPLADRMERCAQYCQAKKVGIPPAFFAAKRMVEGEIPKKESKADERYRINAEAKRQVLQKFDRELGGEAVTALPAASR